MNKHYQNLNIENENSFYFFISLLLSLSLGLRANLLPAFLVLVLFIFFSLLKEKNYSGWLVVEAEQDPVKANPFEYAKIGYKYLSKTAKDCGFEIIN